MVFNEDWTADVAYRKHKYRIKSVELAERSGYSVAYLATVLNGNKKLSDKAAENTKERILKALDELETERKKEAEKDDHNE